MANTTNLQMPRLEAAQSQKHVTHNEALDVLDVVVQLMVLDRNLATPPGSPADGDRYIVATSPTGAWTGAAGKIAARLDGAWEIFTPREGWQCWVADENVLLVYDGTNWVDFASGAGLVGQGNMFDGTIGKIGVNTTADNTNRLSVRSVAALFTTISDHMRITVNKQAAGNDAGFTMQTNFSTRALFGLLGDDDFTIKVSPDGSTFYTGLVVDKDTGNVAIGTGSDGTNKLLVQGTNMLFTSSGSLSFTFNKNATGNDCALTFQSGFSARALVGLLANDDFTFKLTRDASTYWAGIRTHKDLHGRTVLKQGQRRQEASWTPRPGTTTLDQLGLTATVTGTANAATPASSNLFTQAARVRFTSGAGAGSSSGANGSALALWRGNASSLGGFYLEMRFGIETFQTGSRGFAGLYSSASVIGNVNPSTLLNIVGVGWDASETTMRIMSNDGTGAATRTDLGANFPVNSGQTMYELILSAEPNGSEIRYRVENLNSGNVAEGVLSIDLPTNTSFMTPHLWYNNGATAAAVDMSLANMYCENACMLGGRGAIG